MAVAFTRSIPALGKLYGAYSPVSAAPAGATLYSIAGQLGGTPEGDLPGDGSVYAQTKQSFANLGVALDATGLGFADVLRFNTFLVDRSSIEQFMSARREVFADIYPDGGYPPNTLVLVAGLVEAQFSVEIEALAAK